MADADPFERLAAFAAACLLVLWAVGSLLVALFKVGWQQLYGVWPDTTIYGILPDFLNFDLSTMPRDDLPTAVWRFVLGCDLLHVLLVVPPVLLVVCLLVLRRGHGGVLPALRRTANHFGPPLPGHLPPGRPRRV
ncbi:hypothetical protein [Solidesulfovibrio magneticus]|uniref:Hypothetical membrane protein n=1 Tax=Solidesulfovibrio magneticus (strain ATCC 700980 / DSM 13731 / RS-1) TaxID=573370 RepID=C4XMD5_SOLM1|nr:hypothetical protein [Solidesulfovibrio magneticus]BAH77260.1 hypothetical membrane protein [Solidesulfovibrio magneticus RS-1]